MRYKVYFNELEEKSNELINYSKNNINNKITELENIFNGVNWYGKGYNTYINNYNMKIEKLKRINNNIYLLANYLKECHYNYSEADNELGKSWNNLLDEIKGDINGL